MKTNAIISALCVVGIIGALCSNGEEQRSVVEPRPGALPVQKVVYWSDIPGMKWDWSTQITNKPTGVSAFNNDAGYVDAQTATNIVTGVVPAWARSNKKPTYSYSEIQNRPSSIGGFVVITNIVDGEVVGGAMVYPDHEQEGIFVAPYGGIELSAEHDDDLGWFVGIGLSQTNDFASKAWVRSQEYVPASTATNIAKQIIRNAVSNVNVNLQSAEDTRVALTNLITILKNL